MQLNPPSHPWIRRYNLKRFALATDQVIPLLVALTLILGALLRLALAWRELTILDTLFFPDDTYISLGIARNIGLGHGSTLDFHTTTNAYQPLYVLLMAPVYWLFPQDRVLPIHLAVTFLGLAGVATGWYVYAITRYLLTPVHGLIACVIWLFDATILSHNLNGLETGLALLGIAASAHWYLTRIRGCVDAPLRDWLILGVLTGITLFTRVDQAFLLAAIGLDLLLLRRNFHTFRQLCLVGIVALLLNAPWITFGFWIGAGPMPESGPAIRFHALAELAPVPLLLRALFISHALLQPLLTTPWSVLVLLVSGIVATIYIRRVRPQPMGALWSPVLQKVQPLRFALLYGILILLAYGLFVPALWFFPRYLQPLALFLLIGAVALIPDLTHLARRQQRLLGTALVLLLLVEIVGGARFLWLTPAPNGYLGIAQWVNSTLAGATVGSYQTGALSYWGDQVQIVNMDGIVDRTILAARRQGQLGAALQAREVDWVIHWSKTPGFLPDGDLSLLQYQEPISAVQTWDFQWHLFKVAPSKAP